MYSELTLNETRFFERFDNKFNWKYDTREAIAYQKQTREAM